MGNTGGGGQPAGGCKAMACKALAMACKALATACKALGRVRGPAHPGVRHAGAVGVALPRSEWCGASWYGGSGRRLLRRLLASCCATC